MATLNPFDLLEDDDTGELSLLIPAQKRAPPSALSKKGSAQSQAKPQPTAQAKLPSKPLPPAQAVRESKFEGARGGGRGGRGGSAGYRRDFANNENSFGNRSELAGRGAPRRRGGHRYGFGDGERPRRMYERHSGTGRG